MFQHPEPSDAPDVGTNSVAGTETGVVTLVIPPVATLAPARASRVGGVARVHPHWNGLTSEPAIAAGPVANWGPGVVTSFEPPLAITFHRRSGSFAGLSAKTGETMSGIGPHEQAQAEELEVDPVWSDFRLQGGVITWTDGHYTFDFLAHHVVDGLVAGEVKADASWFLDPDYAVLMANAARTLAGVGIVFRKVHGGALHGNVVRRRNVRRAYCNRFTSVPDSRRQAVEAELADGREMRLGDVHRILGNDPRASQQLVDALMVNRVLTYDLDLPVHDDTVVRAAPPVGDHADIRNLELVEAA